MTKLFTWALVAGLGLSLSACAVNAKEEKEEKEENEVVIKFSEAPAAVQKTLTEEAKGAKLDKVDKEMRHGKTVYEADATINGKEYEIVVAEDGTLIAKKLEADDEEHEGKDGKEEKEEHEKGEKK